MSVAAGIRLLVLDVDGCLTDGRIAVDAGGWESKAFHVKDGLGLRVWQDLGRHAAIVTGRRSGSVTARAQELGIGRVYQGVKAKDVALAEILEDLRLPASAAAAMGDDWNDLPMLTRVGLAACPSDAAEQVRALCGFVSSRPGGGGAVRELVDHLLAAQGLLEQAVARYRR